MTRVKRKKIKTTSCRRKWFMTLMQVGVSIYLIVLLVSMWQKHQDEDVLIPAQQMQQREESTTLAAMKHQDHNADRDYDHDHEVKKKKDKVKKLRKNEDEIVKMMKQGTQGSTIELIQSGYLNLIDIHKSSKSEKSADAVFCNLDFSLHKNDPASVPMFKDLIEASPRCQSTKVIIDLNTAVKAAREHDMEQSKTGSNKTKSLAPKGFVFHESRCGSTLVANSLIAFEPPLTRVYSESGPPITAAKMFHAADESHSIQHIKDVIYLMGRTNDLQEENLFFKIQSIGSKSIHIFRKAFPTTPWIYVYRDPVQVMRSHLKKKGTTKAVCLRNIRNPPTDMIELVHNTDYTKNAFSLSTEEHCAAHLATLCTSAVKNVEASNGLGRLVNYVQLPDILIEDIIPKHFLQGHPTTSLSQEAAERVMEVNQKYSKGRDTGKVWKEDSEEKESTAWKQLKDASEKYLHPVYERMESIRKEL